MDYKRIHVRVPISGTAVLSQQGKVHIKASTIDISQGGLAIAAEETPLPENTYHVEITTQDGKTIQLEATLIRQNGQSAGFQTCSIDKKNMHVITQLVSQYQSTVDFIEQLDKHNLMEQTYVDDEGNELEVTFDIEVSQKKS